jgi:hypothetical protein
MLHPATYMPTKSLFFDRTRDVRANAAANVPETRRELWELSLDLTGAPEPS